MNFKMPIVDKYMFSQILAATFVCLILIVIIWIAPEILVKIIRQIFIDHIGLRQAGLNLFYELPKVFNMVIPISILIGCVYTFDNLSKNSELIIIRSSGISFTRLMYPAIILGFAFMFVCYFIGDKLIPYVSTATGENSNYDKHFVYIVKDKEDRLEQGIIISNHQPEQIKNLVVVNFSKDDVEDIVKFDSIITAPYALKGENEWTLPTAKKYQISEDGIYTEIANIKDYKILNKDSSKEVYELMKNATRRDRSFTVKQLKHYVKLLKKHNYTDKHNYYLMKIYQRFLHPLTCILFAIIGCLSGYSPPRSQRTIGFLTSAAVLFAYYITLPFFDMIAEKSVLNPLITALIPIFAFIFIIYATKKAKDL